MTSQLKNWGLVLIADSAAGRSNLTLDRTDLEQIDIDYLTEITAGLNRLCNHVTIYGHPRQFIENIGRHKEDIVLSIWSGQRSRNRRGLVSSICEAYNIRYVGADTYTGIICQDKALAKDFAAKFGLSTPRSYLVCSSASLELIKGLQLPLVVKPNFEGGSIGISAANLVYNYGDAITMAQKLTEIFCQPILVEEFVEGSEVSLVLLGRGEEVFFKQLIEVSLGSGVLLERTIYSYEIKKDEASPVPVVYTMRRCPTDLAEAGELLFRALDKVEILRIDGRMMDDTFQLIELTPDIHLGTDGAYAEAFRMSGFDYHEMLEIIIANSLGLPVGVSRSANMR